MWGLWLFPLVVLLFLVGIATAFLWYFASNKDRRPNIAAVVAIPFGCAAAPILGLALVASISSFFQKNDSQLFEEALGYRPFITEDRMLFDDFGSAADREIFLRTEPNETERRELLAIPGLVPSEYTPEQFAARGAQHGLSWWFSPEPQDGNYCKSVRIRDAHGFRGWHEFRVAECLEGGAEFPASANSRYVYIVAAGRS